MSGKNELGRVFAQKKNGLGGILLKKMNGLVEINGLGGISAQKKYAGWVKQTGWVEILLKNTKWGEWNECGGQIFG